MKRRGVAVFLAMALMLSVLPTWDCTNGVFAEASEKEAAAETAEMNLTIAEGQSEGTPFETAEIIAAGLTETCDPMTAEDPEIAESSIIFVFQAFDAGFSQADETPTNREQGNRDLEPEEEPETDSGDGQAEAETGEYRRGAELAEEEQKENPEDECCVREMKEAGFTTEPSEEEAEANFEENGSDGEMVEAGFAADPSEKEPETDSGNNTSDEEIVETGFTAEPTKEEPGTDSGNDCSDGETDEAGFTAEPSEEETEAAPEGYQLLGEADGDGFTAEQPGEETDGNTDSFVPEPTESPERELTASSVDGFSLGGQAGNAAFQITGLSLTPVDTNSKYSTLTFSFTSGDSEYSCLVTGLGGIGTAGGSGGEEESCEQLAEAIASSFLAGEVFTLSDQTAQEQFGLSLNLIDAEKNSKSGDDHNICWAASTADMLEFAGWNVSADEGNVPDEDTAYQEFRDSFSDLGGYQTAGISWYLDGVNPEQYTSSSSGEIVYRERTDGAAQQLEEGTGGHWTQYAAAEAAPEYGYYDGIDTLLEDAVNLLEEGYAVGLGTYNYTASGDAVSGHALTVFGAVREWLDQAASVLRALFVADSDDRASGSITSVPPEDRPDEYVMYSLTPYENDSISSLQLENYSGSYSTVIGMVSTLQPRETARTETEGTADAVHSPNLIPSELRIADGDGISLTEAEAGTTVTVETDFENRSYQGLPEGATVQYQVNVYRDGELASQTEHTVTADGLEPNHSVSASTEITLDRPGEYTFETRVTQILSPEGEPIREAYLNDNVYSGVPRMLTVPENSEENSGGEEDPNRDAFADNSFSGRKQGEPGSTGEKIWNLTVVLVTDTEYALHFEVQSTSSDSFLRLLNRGNQEDANQSEGGLQLRNRDTGKTVDPANYRILSEEEGFRIVFAESFIRSLRPGRNNFELTWNGGRVLIRITLR